MVKRGQFSVELIHADSGIVFPEHTAASGETYVEVEPGAEYFIRVGTDSEEPVFTEFMVDGEDLGHNSIFDCEDSPFDTGLCTFKNGEEITTALVFCRIPARETPVSQDPATTWTGKVQVSFSQAIFEGYLEQDEDHTYTWQGGDEVYVGKISGPDTSKVVKSDVGETVQVSKPEGPVTRYLHGDLLETITLCYCSTLGLVNAGVIPEPPLWDMHRMNYPRDANESPVPSPIVRRETMKQYVGNIWQDVEIEVLDLTESDVTDDSE